MGAVKLTFFYLCILLFSPVSLAADATLTPEQTRVINYAKHNVTESIAKLGDKIEACQKEREKAKTPDLDLKNPAIEKISKKQLSEAILYLSSRNTAFCEGDTRIRASHDAQNLAAVLREYGSKGKDGIEAANKGLLRPDISEIKNGAVFFYFPEDTKKYLNKAVGKRPFDPVQTIKENRVFPSRVSSNH